MMQPANLIKKNAHKSHTKAAFRVLAVLCVLRVICNLHIPRAPETFNSVPGHHISKHLTSLLIFQFTCSYPHYCTTTVTGAAFSKSFLPRNSNSRNIPGLRACLWSWP